jgi:hypothetical protein
MTIPDRQLTDLRTGDTVVAEVAASRTEFRAFVMVIPQVAGTETAIHRLGGRRVRDPSCICGFEIRYLEHRATYTELEWGWDYDHVLDDETTRVRRVHVKDECEIAAAVSPWLRDLSQLREPADFDSSLVNSPIECYLNRPDERPHLWV